MNAFDFSLGFGIGMILVMFIAHLLPKPKEKGELYKFKCVPCGAVGKITVDEKLDSNVLYCPNCGLGTLLISEKSGRTRELSDRMKKKRGGKIL